MFYLKRSWIVVLLLFSNACATSRPEPTQTLATATPSVTAANETLPVSHAPAEPTATQTLRATVPASETPVPQVQPIYNAINIRSGPGEEYNEIALLYRDETTIVVGTDDYGNWYEVRTEDGQGGWGAASVVEMAEGQIVLAVSPTAASQLAGDSETPRLQVTVSSAYIRSGPGLNYPVIDSVTQGSTVTVLGYTSSGAWFNVRLSDGRRGWIGASVTEPVGGWTLEEISVAGTVPAPPSGGNNQQITPLPATTTSSAVCGCSGNIYNCSNFGSQGAAQACYEYCREQTGRDVHDLDRDNDGRACEALP